MAIGDSNNDISMFEKVRYSVAMGNAKEDIKAICTETTLNNDENGVAHAIYRYIDTFVVQR
jgi:hydroxymethylpyrimidine pyrophosphatase-like HAD family hydrolase